MGLSAAGLEQVRATLAAYVDRGDLPGLAYLVQHGDDVHTGAIGTLAFDCPTPMATDSIFRIASLSKPIVAVAALTLVADGTLTLDAPVARWLPELSAPRVLRTLESALDDTVPAQRPITVDDVLSYRMGSGVPLAMPNSTPVQRRESELELRTWGPPWPPTPHTPDEWIRAFATLPLLHQPGDGWRYNTSGTVLGVLVERATGKPLEVVLRERVFEPLGMHDTAFSVRPDQHDRFTSAYFPHSETGRPELLDDRAASWWSTPPAMPDGSGWLVSTLDDLARFVRMVAVDHGAPVVDGKWIDEMTRDHLTAELHADVEPFAGARGSWGYGLAVRARDATSLQAGDGYGWDGGTGTTWRTNPASGVTAVLLTQRSMTSPQPPAIFTDFHRATHEALT